MCPLTIIGHLYECLLATYFNVTLVVCCTQKHCTPPGWRNIPHNSALKSYNFIYHLTKCMTQTTNQFLLTYCKLIN